MTESAKLAKFGGACVSEPDMYRRIAGLIRNDTARQFLVVSAISGVTDSILASVSKPLAEKEIDSFVAEMRHVHLRLLSKGERAGDVAVEAIEALCTKLSRLLYGISYTEEITPRVQDFALSFGERLAAQVIASNLRIDGVDAVSFEADQIGLMTDENYGNASVLLEETKLHMAPFLRRQEGAGHVSVITGFFGQSPEGKTATFGRGGSDYSAAVVAYALGLPLIEIWKDIGGFMSADPKIVRKRSPSPPCRTTRPRSFRTSARRSCIRVRSNRRARPVRRSW